MAELRFDITPFLDQDEGQHFDRKSLYEGEDSAKRSRNRRAVRDQVAEYVAGFANAEGGVLILGIEDDRTMTGHQLPQDALNSILKTPSTRLKPAQPDGFIMNVQRCELIVFDVPASDVPVQVIGDGFPLRMGDQTVQSSESQINTLKFEGMAESWESRRSSMTLADLDERLLERARQGAGLSALSDEEYLLKRKLADHRGRGIVLRNAAELLFARYGPDHPNAGVRLFRVIGTERYTGPEHNVEERPRCEGNLPAVISEIRTVISSLLRRPMRLVGSRFQESVEYPDFAWLEALLNAIAHRDYRVEGAGIEVWLFDDRMEVVSPGGLVGNLTTEALLTLKRVHHSRNPRMIRVLVDLGLARDQGEGIPRMFAEMEDAFLPRPDIDATNRSVTVTLRNTLTLNASDRKFISALGDLELSRHEFRTLLYTYRHGQIDNARLRALSGLDTLSASYLLRGLRDRDLLALHSHGPNSYYTLTSVLKSQVGEYKLETGESRAKDGEFDTDGREFDTDTGKPGADGREFSVDGREFDADGGELPDYIRARIAKLGKRPRRVRVRPIIHLICNQGKWVTSAELAGFLNIGQGKLTAGYITPMMHSGELESRFPDKPNHPRQAYRAVASQRSETS
ncbi:MAG: hypothetical protein F4Y79_02905 [Gemmatimonadetes bacterium]|nr:hypothetical protein [Gemmatimonadota bacterium]